MKKIIDADLRIKSGSVKLQVMRGTDNDTTIYTEEAFLISTPKDTKYLVYQQDGSYSYVYCKSARTLAMFFSENSTGLYKYAFSDNLYDAKWGATDITYPLDLPRITWENCTFQRIPPRFNKKNIRYKISYPDDDITSDMIDEWEFDEKSLHLVEWQSSSLYMMTDQLFHRINVSESALYNYIHPDILDTISFKYEELKKGADKRYERERSEKDSIYREIFRDSIMRTMVTNEGSLTQSVPLEVKKDTIFFMPKWKFPSLTGDTIYSENITSHYLLLDMWYASCHPCRMAMREIASSIDTLYEESLLKLVSLNVFDHDTAKIRQVSENLNFQSDIACAYGDRSVSEMTKKMGLECNGYPQIYLIDLNSKKVLWKSCGWREGFTKEIEEIIANGN
ncbi:hypothetical protein LJC68_08000 [Bacteroidales bacterium OttesenSCG-928-B11]|nr:hypothetical protein [Bacteroidales bacterium OttesenSCG-928-B11]MDL2326436.1 hypothetical protein [Bacteroidales bacterium OttesenSCG-928-A14]